MTLQEVESIAAAIFWTLVWRGSNTTMAFWLAGHTVSMVVTPGSLRIAASTLSAKARVLSPSTVKVFCSPVIPKPQLRTIFRSFALVIFSGAYLILTWPESGKVLRGKTPSRAERAVVIRLAPLGSITPRRTRTTEVPSQHRLLQFGGHLVASPAKRAARPGSLQRGQGCLERLFSTVGEIPCFLSSPWEKFVMRRNRDKKKSAFKTNAWFVFRPQGAFLSS